MERWFRNRYLGYVDSPHDRFRHSRVVPGRSRHDAIEAAETAYNMG
jgi:hypothetical protein